MLAVNFVQPQGRVTEPGASPRLVLASASPRRAQLLASLGLTFEVMAPSVDETPANGESPAHLVERLAQAKVLEIAWENHEALVIGADTTVTLDGVAINKPSGFEENRRFIERLAGRRHEVFTGHALAYGGRRESFVVRTVVEFRPLSEPEIVAYCRSGEGLDKAGGYAIQGVGATLVTGIEGCYPNVMGLSLVNVVLAARRLGVNLV
ncbi:MAG: Maf family protein [Truepera sp.]|nr:Maf family protein [Truepera sp.]